jgi:hypothetical protein
MANHDWAYVGVPARPASGGTSGPFGGNFGPAGYAVAVCQRCGLVRWAGIAAPRTGSGPWESRLALGGDCAGERITQEDLEASREARAS